MRKEKNSLEYMLKAGSGNIYGLLSVLPSGLETWFADKVTFKDKSIHLLLGKNRNTAS